ncbi:hypothetical protein HOG48_02750 [Candidatus Peregrinibacteria bacterium]|jgi:hypothetical protein|nr:hypothetical protein [Candidatus Peregrinibacteria bacterium]
MPIKKPQSPNCHIEHVVSNVGKFPKPSIKSIKRFFEALYLDVLSIPGLFMSKKANAKWHLKYVCPKCSKWRRSFRDPRKGGSTCMWLNAWQKGEYEIPRSFGPYAWIKYYLGIKPVRILKKIKTVIDKFLRNK